MSKVLVVTVNQGKETLASAYFHWSASPESSIELTKTILDFENLIKLLVELKVL